MQAPLSHQQASGIWDKWVAVIIQTMKKPMSRSYTCGNMKKNKVVEKKGKEA